MSAIATNIAHVRNELPPGVKLVAVSKNQPVEVIMEAYRAGHRTFGENRVQELVAKHEQLPDDIEWHMIGHLQTNKVKQIVPFVSMIHSIDSMKLLEEVSRRGLNAGRTMDCLLQVFIAEEETKYGLDGEETRSLLERVVKGQFPGVRIRGLMGMATFTDDMTRVRREFRSLKELFLDCRDRFFAGDGHSSGDPGGAFNELSMGMSGDYRIGVEEGSTLVRIGTLIFGAR